MDENKKHSYIRIGIIVFLFITIFFVGFIAGRRGSSDEIRNAKEEVDTIGREISTIRSDLVTAKSELEKLTKSSIDDQVRIIELEDTNNKITEIADKQRRILNEFEKYSKSIGIKSGEIGTGIKESIEDINAIIEKIKERED